MSGYDLGHALFGDAWAMNFLMVLLLCFIFTCIWAMPPCNYTIHIYTIYICILYIYIYYIYTIHIDRHIQFDVWLFEVFACKCRYRYSIHGEFGLFSHTGFHPWMSQCRTSWLMFHPCDHVPSSFSMTGLWFQTFVIFHFLYGMSSFPLTNSIMVQDGYGTTNQMMLHQFLLSWCPFSGLQNNTRLNTWSPGCSGKHQCCDVSSPRS